MAPPLPLPLRDPLDEEDKLESIVSCKHFIWVLFGEHAPLEKEQMGHLLHAAESLVYLLQMYRVVTEESVLTFRHSTSVFISILKKNGILKSGRINKHLFLPFILEEAAEWLRELGQFIVNEVTLEVNFEK